MLIYNTANRKKEELKTIKPNEVGMYACGPTVYSSQHIGNMYAYISWDLLTRYLRYRGYKVAHVMNITDVGHLTSDSDDGEDKMEKGAKKEGLTVWDIAKKYEKEFFDDFEKLNIVRPNIVCKATDHIKEQIEMIEKIEKNAYAYKIDDGIYFDTSKFKEYGDFAKLNLEQIKEGARVEVNEQKKNPTDFALWKFSPSAGSGQVRQMEWESPWGKGFPGWHIECSAMSTKYLGDNFDLHTGGIDHISIHHTNEIAQLWGVYGRKVINYWMHNAFLNFGGEKISKSKGGLFTIFELEKEGYRPIWFRYMVINSHYRRGLEFSLENLKVAGNNYEKLNNIVGEWVDGGEISKEYLDKFIEKIDNDLAMPEAMAILWTMIRDEKIKDADKKATILEMDKILGLNLGKKSEEEIPKEVIDLVEERKIARENKNWAESDRLRGEIQKMGYEIEDTQNDCKIRKLMVI